MNNPNPPLLNIAKLDGNALANFLNDSLEKPGAKERVVALADALRAMQRLMDKTGVGKPRKDYWVFGGNEEIEARWTEINGLLKRYKFRRSLPWVISTAKGRMPSLRASLVPTRRGRTAGIPTVHRETMAVEQVLRLAESSALGFLRQCLECQTWYMARLLLKQKYCGEACERRVGKRNNPGKKARYMKRYRERQRILSRLSIFKEQLRTARRADKKKIETEIARLNDRYVSLLPQQEVESYAKN